MSDIVGNSFLCVRVRGNNYVIADVGAHEYMYFAAPSVINHFMKFKNKGRAVAYLNKNCERFIKKEAP